MANDKNNINELVANDDDPTAELETLADTYDYVDKTNDEPEPTINKLKTDLRNRSETIDHLQFDIEQLRAKWNGLEAEIKAREELTRDLNGKLEDTSQTLARKEKLLRKRDQTIKTLKAEIRDRNDEYGELKAELIKREQQLDALQKELEEDLGAETAADQQELERQAGRLVSAEAEIRELHGQLDKMESYADEVRHKLQERTTLTDRAEGTQEALQIDLKRATKRVGNLENELEDARTENQALSDELSGIKNTHAEDIRLIRFELGEAQETVAQQDLVTEQLASDLVDTRGFRDELEKMLTSTEEQNEARIDDLERENCKLRDELGHSNEQLDGKSEAINCLLAELAKKSQQIESIEEIEDVIQDIDDRMSERIDEQPRRERDRVSRVLIGSVDGQELRFPLFKDRLTIGRTEQNDIQLAASYVSRRHAVIVTDRDATRVIDWGSKNGVFVNSERVTEHFLKNGDNVTIGTADFRYEVLPKRDS